MKQKSNCKGNIDMNLILLRNQLKKEQKQLEEQADQTQNKDEKRELAKNAFEKKIAAQITEMMMER